MGLIFISLVLGGLLQGASVVPELKNTMFLKYRCILYGVFLVALVGFSYEEWRHDRKPRVMGDKIPYQTLMPYRRQIQKRIVLYHNFFRTKAVPKASNMLRLKWHSGAARAAQLWAEKCMFLVHDNVAGRHISNYGSCGQNIFVSSHEVPWLFAIKTWWLEKDNFTYGSFDNDLLVVGHYTQMVWAATHEVGCGLAKCNRIGNVVGKKYFSYVCNYCPMGNNLEKIGQPYKRGKPCGRCKRSCHAKKLCTNSCNYANYWANCMDLFTVWPNWLCRTDTEKGQERLDACRATCLCKAKIHD